MKRKVLPGGIVINRGEDRGTKIGEIALASPQTQT